MRQARRLSFILLALLLLCSMAGCGGGSSSTQSEGSSNSAQSIGGVSGSGDSVQSADNRTWLPDPATALGVSAVYDSTVTESNGVTYDYYTYDLDMTADQMSHFIAVYTAAMEELGFAAKRLDDDVALWYESYAMGSGAAAEMGIFVSSGAQEISAGDTGTWRVVLAVPENMAFYAGSGAPGIVNGNTRCVDCGGTGNCTGCGGTGRANYGDGYKACVLCDESGVCNVCDGNGSY